MKISINISCSLYALNKKRLLCCVLYGKSRVSMFLLLAICSSSKTEKSDVAQNLSMWKKLNFTLTKKYFKHAYPKLNGILSHLIGVPIKFDSWIKRKKKSKQKKLYCHIHLTPERVRTFWKLLKVPWLLLFLLSGYPSYLHSSPDDSEQALWLDICWKDEA